VSDVLSPAISIALAAMLAILFRCVQVRELYHAVDWQSTSWLIAPPTGLK